MAKAKTTKRRKGEWSVQFILKMRTDMGYSCDYFRRQIKHHFPAVRGLSVRRIA